MFTFFEFKIDTITLILGFIILNIIVFSIFNCKADYSSLYHILNEPISRGDILFITIPLFIGLFIGNNRFQIEKKEDLLLK